MSKSVEVYTDLTAVTLNQILNDCVNKPGFSHFQHTEGMRGFSLVVVYDVAHMPSYAPSSMPIVPSVMHQQHPNNHHWSQQPVNAGDQLVGQVALAFQKIEELSNKFERILSIFEQGVIDHKK